MLAAPAEAITRQELTELFIALEVIPTSKAETARGLEAQVLTTTTLLELTNLFIHTEVIPEEKAIEALTILGGQEGQDTYVPVEDTAPPVPVRAATSSELVELLIALEVIPPIKAEEARSVMAQVPATTTFTELAELLMALEIIPIEYTDDVRYIITNIHTGNITLGTTHAGVSLSELTELFIALEVIPTSKAEEARAHVLQVPTVTTLLELTNLFIDLEVIPEEKAIEARTILGAQEGEDFYVPVGTTTPSAPTSTLNQRLNVEIVLALPTESDNGVVYTFMIDVTTDTQTYYVSATSSNVLQFHVEDVAGSTVNVVMGTTTLTSPTATQLGDVFEITPGATETFVLTTAILPIQSGSYRVVLDTLEFCESPILPYGRIHTFEPRSNFTSPSIDFFITSAEGPQTSTQEASVSGGRGALLNPEAHRDSAASTTPRVQLLGTTTPLHLDGDAEIEIDMPQFIELLIAIGVIIPQEKAALARQRIAGM